MKDKVKGGLFGVALGDALGTTLEFMSREEVARQYGELREIVGGGWLGLEAGRGTDDTEMTLAVGEGLLANPDSPVDPVGERFLQWYRLGPKDVGNTIRCSLEHYLKLGDWAEAAKQTAKEMEGKTAGNGGLMRTLPVSFAYYGDPEKIAERSRRICRMTHWDMTAEMCGVLYNLLVACLLQEDKRLAWEKTWQWFGAYLYQEADAKTVELLRTLQNVADWDYRSLRATGYVYDTLAGALWCFFNNDGAEEAIVKAVNLGEDADTVGAVTGGLAGVYYGYQSLPGRWLDVLKGKERLAALATGLSSLMKSS